jgi:hypothetical protein
MKIMQAHTNSLDYLVALCPFKFMGCVYKWKRIKELQLHEILLHDIF